jgi:hypothetical protein
MLDLEDIFGPEGPLQRALPDFRFRRQQLRMADRVAAALTNREALVVEAGTGTGKTFAYLVPALLSGKRVLISTGTRTLQDQLFSKDLPLLSAALGRPARVALLKGRSNYLCRHRLMWPVSRWRWMHRRQTSARSHLTLGAGHCLATWPKSRGRTRTCRPQEPRAMASALRSSADTSPSRAHRAGSRCGREPPLLLATWR